MKTAIPEDAYPLMTRACMIDASRQAAENALMDQTFFPVDAQTYAQFLAVLDRPPAGEAYERLMRAPKPWALSTGG